MYYIRDLEARQNRPITEAQIHSYINAKRYTNKDLEEYCRMSKKQIDLEGKRTNDLKRIKEGSIENLLNRIEELKEEINELEKEIENRDKELREQEKKIIERCFVYNGKLVIIDDEKNILKMKYKEDLFLNLIGEFKKINNWLDARSAYLKYFDEQGSEVIINNHEIDITIKLLEKLNKMPNG